jgi:branched-chain amino acid transport system permease protein
MTVLWAGVSVGAIFALVAVGYNITFTTAGVFNFAQASFMMVGTFTAYEGYVAWHLPVLIVLLLGGLVGALVAVVEERIAIRPLVGKSSHGELVTTVGVAVTIEGIADAIWGTTPRSVTVLGLDRSTTVLGGRVVVGGLVLLGAAVGITLIIQIWARITRSGLASLACAENRTAAMLCGINVPRQVLASFALAGALAGGIGIVVASQTYAVTNLGDTLALSGFVAFAVGGSGNQFGALLGGMIAGLVAESSAFVFGSVYSNLSLFAVLLIVMWVRPTGLLGERRLRAV